jgi:negative regulator of replication initiation
LQIHNEGEEKDLLNSALLDSLNAIYSQSLDSISLVRLRLEAKHL